jgi:hypothetical protein
MSEIELDCDDAFSKCMDVFFNELTTEFELHLKCLDSANQIIRDEYQTYQELLSQLESGCGKSF